MWGRPRELFEGQPTVYELVSSPGALNLLAAGNHAHLGAESSADALVERPPSTDPVGKHELHDLALVQKTVPLLNEGGREPERPLLPLHLWGPNDTREGAHTLPRIVILLENPPRLCIVR